ncbi:MAG: DNA repair protein RecO [Ferruginibacter sp.]
MTHKTKGIVLRTIKYGETSLVVSIFTELFGVNTYMVNGVRSSKKAGARAVLYQPGAILEMEVYHNELKSMQRIKESGWAFLYKNILSDVVKNTIALYIVELLIRSLKQPEQNTDLFIFCEDALIQLDGANKNIAANFPLYFALHLSHFLGFRISNETGNYKDNVYIDLIEGNFVNAQPIHPHFLEGENAVITSELLRIMQLHELEQIKLNGSRRRELLGRYQEYYSLHIPDFGKMKTLSVLHELLAL